MFRAGDVASFSSSSSSSSSSFFPFVALFVLIVVAFFCLWMSNFSRGRKLNRVSIAWIDQNTDMDKSWAIKRAREQQQLGKTCLKKLWTQNRDTIQIVSFLSLSLFLSLFRWLSKNSWTMKWAEQSIQRNKTEKDAYTPRKRVKQMSNNEGNVYLWMHSILLIVEVQ